MKTRFSHSGFVLLTLVLLLSLQSKVKAQRGGMNWAKDGYQYYKASPGGIDELDTRDANKKITVVTKEMIKHAGKAPLTVRGFTYSEDGNKVLIFPNTKRAWRYN